MLLRHVTAKECSTVEGVSFTLLYHDSTLQLLRSQLIHIMTQFKCELLSFKFDVANEDMGAIP